MAKRLGDTTVRMLGYNGSVPGPTLKVQQGSEIIVHVTNNGGLDTTVLTLPWLDGPAGPGWG